MAGVAALQFACWVLLFQVGETQSGTGSTGDPGAAFVAGTLGLLVTVPVGIALVGYDTRTLRNRDDSLGDGDSEGKWGPSWLWTVGALLVTTGAVGAYAARRHQQFTGAPPLGSWYRLLWVSLVALLGLTVVGALVSPSVGAGVMVAGIVTLWTLGVVGTYFDAKTVTARTTASMGSAWAAGMVLFPHLVFPIYALVRYNRVSDAEDVGEEFDAIRESIDLGDSHRAEGDYELALSAYDAAVDRLDALSNVGADEELAERANDLRSEVEEKREGVRAEADRAEFASFRDRAEEALADAREAADAEEYDRARTLATEAAEAAENARKEAAESDVDTDGSLADLHEAATNLETTAEREWLVGRVNAAGEVGADADAEAYEEARAELAEVLDRLEDTDALSGRDLELVRQEALDEFASVLELAAEAQRARAADLAEAGNHADAREAYAEAHERAVDAIRTLDERGLDADTDLESLRAAAAAGYAEEWAADLSARIEDAIETFRAGDREAARDAFGEVVADADDAIEALDGDEADRLESLRAVASYNADAVRRAVLGIGDDDVTLKHPEEGVAEGGDDGTTTTAEGPARSGGGGPPAAIPVAPDVDVSYTDLEKGDRIGQGGSADVFNATVTVDGEEHAAALKEPRMRGTLHAETMERFVEEAETWAKLDDHDFVVEVMAWDSAPMPWLLLELMDGGDLSEHVGEFGFDQAIWTARCVTEGVQHAHSHGVAHLDLKPENVLFRSTGPDTWPVPKVADWGLARALLDDDEGIEGLSPRYAAPEQVDADRFGEPDQATDVYQLGAVFYELFVGRPPFEGTGNEVLTKVVEAEITPPSEADPSLPARLDDALMPALAREKGDRYESVLYLRDALAELADAPGAEH